MAVKGVRSLDEVADMIGISRQRVYEIEKRAFRKLRRALMQEMPTLELKWDHNGSVCGLSEQDNSVSSSSKLSQHTH
jgi:Sigma-70, region 4